MVARRGGALSRKRRRTICRALPGKFRPRHMGGWRGKTWSALYPMPYEVVRASFRDKPVVRVQAI